MSNKSGVRWLYLTCLGLATAACARKTAFQVPDLSDPPTIETATYKDMPDYAPAYGIVIDSDGTLQLEVTIEAADSSHVRVGQAATAFVLPSNHSIDCRVTRVLRGASEETGQSIVWLTPNAPLHEPPGDFVNAKIMFALKRRALTIPAAAIFIRKGHSYVIRQDLSRLPAAIYTATSVTTGLTSDVNIEILSGLTSGDRVVTAGGIGYLYPDFKAHAVAD